MFVVRQLLRAILKVDSLFKRNRSLAWITNPTTNFFQRFFFSIIAGSFRERKEYGATKGAASRLWTAGLGNTASQARTPNRAKRGVRAGTGSGRARVSPTRTAPGRAGRTCSRGAARADRGQRASAAGSEDREAAREGGRRQDAPGPVLRASEGRRWRGAVDKLSE